MEETLVTTVSNKIIEVKNCRLIDKKYYLIGDVKIENSGDVYKINNRFVRFDTGRIVYNFSIKEYQLKNDSLIEGIVEFKEEKPIFGHFEFNPLYCCKVYLKNKESYYCLNENIINLNFREEKSSGTFFHISLKPSNIFNLIKNIDREYKERLPYDSKNVMDRYIDIYNKVYNPVICGEVEKFHEVLKDLTFGLEYETCKGIVPKHKLDNLPVIPLRDGSISGLEYVTPPMSGVKGLQAVIDVTNELSKRTVYDEDCSLHLHIGNIPRTQEFILAFYKVASHFQEELFSMFPLYKKYNFGVKRKNYSKPFPFNLINSQLEPSIDSKLSYQLTKNFKVLFDYLAEVVPYETYNCDLKNVESHPLDPAGNQKWNINTRYYAINFIPLIFGNKQTIEFRIHTPTYDIDKIINFLFINSYLINFAKENCSKILKDPKFVIGFNLTSFVKHYVHYNTNLNKDDKGRLKLYHENYIRVRKERVEKFNSQGNIKGSEDQIKFKSYINWNNEKSFTPLEINIKSDSNISFSEKLMNETKKYKKIPLQKNEELKFNNITTKELLEKKQKTINEVPYFLKNKESKENALNEIKSNYDLNFEKLKKELIDVKERDKWKKEDEEYINDSLKDLNSSNPFYLDPLPGSFNKIKYVNSKGS